MKNTINWILSKTDILPEDELNKIPPSYLIRLFIRNGKLNYILNELLNTNKIYNLSSLEVASFIRYLIQKNNISINNLSFPKSKETKNYEDYDKFPFLKEYEICLLNYIKNDTNSKNRKKINIHNDNNEKIPLNDFINNFTFDSESISIIDSKFSNCKTCPLINFPSCILETNCTDNLKNVDIIFIAENPGYDEIKQRRPLIGRAGQVFRRFFDQFELSRLNYLLTNIVLCQTITYEGRTTNPSIEVIKNCRNNAFNIIKICNPKLIVLMGSSAAIGFDFINPENTKNKISNLRGNFYSWNNYPVFITFHPSFILRNKNMEDIFEGDFEKIYKYISKHLEYKEEKQKMDTNITDISKIESDNLKIDDNIVFYRIPDKYYTKDYILRDVQVAKDKILYIFRNKKGEKEYYLYPDMKYYYYIPEKDKSDKNIFIKTKEISSLKLVVEQFPPIRKNSTFNADIPVDVKHVIDYYIQNKGEPDVPLKIMYIDIEVYSKTGEFSDPEEAKSPIVLITYKFDNKIETLFYDTKEFNHNIKDLDNIIIFDNEKKMLKYFVSTIKKLDPDVLTGWNFNYDLTYLTNRMKLLNLDINTLSPFNIVKIPQNKNNLIEICGFICLDMLDLYKKFTPTKKESYSLDFIASSELGKSKYKIDHKGQWNKCYEELSRDFILYNREDVNLLNELESKLSLIALQDELRKICNTTFKLSHTTLGLIEGLIQRYFKDNKLVSETTEYSEITENSIPGAFVFETNPGIYNWIVDFDFTSLYPSLILTYNIGPNTFVGQIDPKIAYEITYKSLDSLPNEIEIKYNDQIKTISKEIFTKFIKSYKPNILINGSVFLDQSIELSYYFSILKNLTESRKRYKDKMFEYKQKNNIKKYTELYIKQTAYKILSNALYGVLANERFRFFNPTIASSITLSGKELIKHTMVHINKFLNELYDKNKDNINKMLLEDLSKDKKYEISNNKLSIDDLNKDNFTKSDFIIAGDTDSIFVNLNKFISKDLTEQEDRVKLINNICNLIQNFVNNYSIPHLIKLHKFNNSENYLNIKNELIISRALFLAKKKYAAKVISNEGTIVDEIITRGLETRRSDFPILTKYYLNNLLHHILEENIKLIDLLKMINKINNEFIKEIKSGNKNIARPVTFVRNEKDYKKTPPNVIAMQNWNILMGKSFYPGSKGYLFKINGIDKSKCPPEILIRANKIKDLSIIAIPDHQDKLPDFFIIDVKAMLKFAWEDRWKLLLAPIVEVQSRLPLFQTN